MKWIFVPILLFVHAAYSAPHVSSHGACVKALATEYKRAHEILPCAQAAAAGHPDILYAIGMSHGYAGADELSMQYYQASAQKGFPPAFLAIGHVMLSEPYNNKLEAIAWYKRYVQTKYDGWGYASTLISKLYGELGETELAEKWAATCRQSTYVGCPK